jgi:hypothetical protein
VPGGDEVALAAYEHAAAGAFGTTAVLRCGLVSAEPRNARLPVLALQLFGARGAQDLPGAGPGRRALHQAAVGVVAVDQFGAGRL